MSVHRRLDADGFFTRTEIEMIKLDEHGRLIPEREDFEAVFRDHPEARSTRDPKLCAHFYRLAQANALLRGVAKFKEADREVGRPAVKVHEVSGGSQSIRRQECGRRLS